MVKNSRYLARTSLSIMGVGFVATLPFEHTNPFLGLLHGGFEAGIVGGLADWFAVTALFRHPLGIPIPHTSLLAKNRKRMTKALVSVIERDWLSKESIVNKLKNIQLTEKLIIIAKKEIYSESFKKRLLSFIEQLILQIDIKKFAPIITKQIKGYLGSYNINSLLANVVNLILDRQYDQKTLDYLLNQGEEWVSKEESKLQLGSAAVKALNKIELDGFLQFALKSFQSLVNEEKLGKLIQKLLKNIISDLKQPDSQNREKLLSSIHFRLDNLKNNEKVVHEIEGLKETFLQQWDPNEQLEVILENLSKQSIEFIHNDHFWDNYLFPLLNDLLNKLSEDENKITNIENWLHTQITHFIETNHSKIGKLVQENLDKLDDEMLIDMIENNVGKDLQWIRVNGAICGFIIGVCITGIKLLIQ
ncbi:DUF445 domain-containing protein [Heyndrickxia sp. NPDC080065]|uniref:DUF445 domain-containing protein n=1 Tax=Heyndrickxia sp. NPDC080065 TaxID=3390568 RepID=UPI003CFEE7BB